MELSFDNSNDIVKKHDRILVMQELDGRPRIISYGIIVDIIDNNAIASMDSNDFVSEFPFYVVKTSEMIEVNKS